MIQGKLGWEGGEVDLLLPGRTVFLPKLQEALPTVGVRESSRSVDQPIYASKHQQLKL